MRHFRNRVRNSHGVPLLCCWDDCEESGLYEYRMREEDSIMVFCSERHMSYHRNSHRGYGRLPTGERNRWALR